MKWFDRWLMNKFKKISLNESTIESNMGRDLISAPQRFGQAGMGFRVYRASGGYVLESSNYNDKTDRHNSNLHVITDDQDLGQAIGQIVIVETLRQ